MNKKRLCSLRRLGVFFGLICFFSISPRAHCQENVERIELGVITTNAKKEIENLSIEIIKMQQVNEGKILLGEVRKLKDKAYKYQEIDKEMVHVINKKIDMLYEKAEKYSQELDRYLMKEILAEIRNINEKIRTLEDLANHEEKKPKEVDYGEELQANALSKENIKDSHYVLILLGIFEIAVLIFVSRNRVSRIEGFGAKIFFHRNNKKNSEEKTEEEEEKLCQK